jgi:hypothetical protein
LNRRFGLSVPLSSHEIDGVRKEKERLTAAKKKKTKQNGRTKKRFLQQHFVNYYICEKMKKTKTFYGN